MVILIGGHVRSGTSLLRDICNSHPDIVMTHEFGAFLGIGKSYDMYQQRMLQAWKRKSRLRYNIFRYRGVASFPIKTVYAAMRGHLFTARFLMKMRQYRQQQIETPMVEAAYRSLFPNVKFVGDKWPDYARHLDTFVSSSEVLPIIIYRDCRDVVSSTLKLVRTNWRNEAWTQNADTAEKIAKRWVTIIDGIEQHHEHICCIRYEDLVQQPAKELKTLGNRLDVDLGKFPMNVIQSNRVGKYEIGLTPAEVEDIIKVAGPTMSRLGYM